MATDNFTDQGIHNKLHSLQCLEDLTSGMRSQMRGLSVVNIVLSITAILGNTLILIALQKESSLHPPSKLLLRNLAATDLFVGLILEPVAVFQWISVISERSNLCHYAIKVHFILGFLLGSVSILTLTAISVDRLLALLLGLRYKQVVTLKRTFVIAIAIWILSTIAVTMYFWNYRITLWCAFIGQAVCLPITIFSYTKIFLTLRRHQTQVRGDLHQQPNQTSALNIARYRKAVSCALWLQVFLVICYLPNGIVQTLTAIPSKMSRSVLLARKYTVTLVYLNSSLNPILYYWKIKEVREAVKGTIKHVLCS